MTPNRIIDLARELATALDREDYIAVTGLLSPRCAYRIRSSVFTGPEAIIDSYRTNGAWAAEALDSIEYESRVEPVAAGGALITFVDKIRHRGEEHVHMCQQAVGVDESGLIGSIEHRDLPGEREALESFFSRMGVERGVDG